MDDHIWNLRVSNSLNPFQSSRSDLYIDLEENDGDDDASVDFPCPFCSDDFDIVELCCHIDDDHHMEADSGVCPICVMAVRANMVEHITIQHEELFKIQYKRKLCKGESFSTLSLLKKEFQEEHLHSLLGGPSSGFPSSNTSTFDQLLSFISNLPLGEESESTQPNSSAEASSTENCSEEIVLEKRKIQASPSSDKDQEEEAKRCEFVQGLLMSTFLDDEL